MVVSVVAAAPALQVQAYLDKLGRPQALLGQEVAGDSSRLVQDELAVVEVRQLTEGMRVLEA